MLSFLAGLALGVTGTMATLLLLALWWHWTNGRSPVDEFKRTARRGARMDRREWVDRAEADEGLRKLLEAKDCFVRAAVKPRRPQS